MKKLGYLLSIAAHALLWLLILAGHFSVASRPGPPRLIAVRIAEPPLPLAEEEVPATPAPIARALPTAGNRPAERGPATSAASSAAGGQRAPAGASSLATVFSPAAAGGFRLSPSPAGSFRLAPAGKTPEPWALPVGPAEGPRLRHYSAGAWGTRAGGEAGGQSAGGVLLEPFDIKEKGVGEWVEAVLARVERNWTVPASARFAFAGRVQVTLTIEKSGRSRALAVEPSSLPEPLSLAALHAVEASLPLPALPEHIAGEAFAFTFVFVYNG